MFFNTSVFMVFFIFVLGFYYILNHRLQNTLLLAASYLFYGYWDYRFLFLLLFSTVLDYICGIKIDEAKDDKKRKVFFIISIIGNLGVLCFFKYFNFFIDSVKMFLTSLGLVGEFYSLNILLPAGISFYTFQSMSYCFEIYRKHLKPCYYFPDYALFVSFFPHLVAGPIMRSVNLLPQITNKRTVDAARIRMGLELFLIGMFKKVVIADTVGVLFVDKAFSNPEIYSGTALMLAALMFSLQIYCDFSGYSDMAIGMSKLMGIELTTNFNQPYFSTSFREFWKRWHISLSTWLRDYLYIPLGGNQRGRNRTYINLMLTMLLGGLWHGAQWTFVIWGGIHGALLSLEQIIIRSFKLPSYMIRTLCLFSPPPLLRKFCQGVLVSFIVTLIWIFFRSSNVVESLMIISRIFTFQHGVELSNCIVALLCIIGILAIDIPQAIYKTHTFFNFTPNWLNNIYYTAMLSALLMVPLQNAPFIYFQF